MIELEMFTPELASKKNKTLLLCDESFITCINLPQLRNLDINIGNEIVLGIPSYEYQRGKRGWAKIQILAAVNSKIRNILPLGYDEALNELQQGEWGEVVVNGKLIWVSSESINTTKKEQRKLNILETSDPFDCEMIKRAGVVKETSNCWLDPAGVVFTKGESVLIESTSTSLNNSHCHDIPINFSELPLEEGERMIFCDSLHAERVGISQAAQTGVSLYDSTMYVSKFPCRPCAISAISAGVKTIIFEKGSYGLLETADLFDANNITLKKVSETK